MCNTMTQRIFITTTKSDIVAEKVFPPNLPSNLTIGLHSTVQGKHLTSICSIVM